MASPRRFAFDDEDRPSGSVRPLRQADLQAIQARLSDDPDELLAGTGEDWPVVAVRVRASVGRPGGSAQATWRRTQAAEWTVLHDLALPGSRANLDHLVIGPGGVFVIDSKQYRGRLQLDRSGRLWHGRYPLAKTLQAVSFEADQAALILTDPDVVVVPVMAVHGTQVPWGKVVMNGVPVVPARRLPSMLRQLPAVLGPERVAGLADQARVRFHAAA